MPSDPYAHLAGRYLDHAGTLRGRIRHALVDRQLRHHLNDPPAVVLDAGAGDGRQSIPLARDGYEVVLLDPSATMLGEARGRLSEEDEGVSQRVRLVQGTGESAADIPGSAFDAVLCHGVLMYLPDPEALLRTLSSLVRAGGFVSLLVKNRRAMAMRPGLTGDYEVALRCFDAHTSQGGLGVTTRGDTVEDLMAILSPRGFELAAWYGIRVFTDHLGEAPAESAFPGALAAEWAASQRDPYRGVARLLHLVARRTESNLEEAPRAQSRTP
ncbi:methyltransferase domain-containing protein [soil metagenome]